MNSLLHRLQKIEDALAEKVELCRKSLYQIYGETKAQDDDGQIFNTLDEAKAANPDADVWIVVNPDTIRLLKELREKADTI
jgi:hypothetical protein